MKPVFTIRSIKEFELLTEWFNSTELELVLSFKVLSRFGCLELSDLNKVNEYLNSHCIKKITILWDILMTDHQFSKPKDQLLEILKKLEDYETSIRVQDPGAMFFVHDCLENKIQLICETGNVNLESLKSYREYLGERVERIVLNGQLSSNSLISEKYSEILGIDLEILGLGPILLFYSPRPLGKNVIKESFYDMDNGESPLEDNIYLGHKILAHSEESSHKNFPIYFNNHGSFMFYSKYQCLLDEFSTLSSCGVNFFRIELEGDKTEFYSSVLDVYMGKKSFSDFKSEFPVPLIKSFFRVNKSDVLFKKLKNQRLLKSDSTYLGEVLDVAKEKGLVIQGDLLKLQDYIGKNVIFMTPEGKGIKAKLKTLKNLVFQENNLNHQLVISPFVKGVVPKTLILKE